MTRTTPDILTFGCRLNLQESEVIRGHMVASGQQNVAVVNTCAVTKEAERQARQAIRRYHREHPEAKIVVTGCAAQIAPEGWAALPGVTHVLGNEEKLQAENYPKLFGADGEEEPIRVNDIMAVQETAGHIAPHAPDRARAFLQVQNGCNHRCTFCIIPYGRGNSRSVPVGEVVKHANTLVEQGFRELVLTGVDLTDYGSDLPGRPTLGEMVRRLLTLVPELPRVRLSSIDVAEVDDVLTDLICHEARLMPHLHLSLQSGDNMVLKRMARRHTREGVLRFAEEVWAKRPEIVFGADIIAGFPTETEGMFENSLDLVRQLPIPHLHVFPYSEREGTPAARIPAEKHVPVKERKARAATLRAEGERQLQALLHSRIGKTERVVLEKGGLARTEQFLLMQPETPHIDAHAGQLAEMRVIGTEAGRLVGCFVAEDASCAVA